MKALLAKIRMILKDRRTRQLLTRTVSVTAALVVFVTTYALVLPAITMESEALCGVETHQHDDSCYTEELVCGIPESEGHQHTEACYRKILTCGKEVHTHSTECYKDTAASTVMMEGAAVASDESSEIIEMDPGEEESSEFETFADTENEDAFEAGENGSADGDAAAFAEADQFSVEGDRHSGEEDQFSEEEDQVLEEDGETADSETEEDAYAAAVDAADEETDEEWENESSETDFPADGDDGESGLDAVEAELNTDGEDGEIGSGPADADHSIDGEEESESGTAEEGLSNEEDGEDESGETDLAAGEDGEDGSGEAADASGTGAADAEMEDESVLHEAGDQTDADSAGTSTAAESETADSADTAAGSEIASTAGTEDPSADPSAAAKEGYVPVHDQLHFARILNKKTAIYYSHAADQTDGSADNQTDGSADGAEAALFDTAAQDDQEADLSLSEGTAPDPAADWKKVNKDTELAPADLLRVYLAYTIPAGELNETNAVARYRLPSGLHLTDDQIRSINTTVNGIAAQYVDYDKLEILDVEAYNKYLGIEAVEGTRRPSDDIREYLEKNDQEEYISATVKAENVYNEISGELEGQDLIFTFATYTVMKNRHEYDAEGKPVKAGEKVRGWVCLDLTTDQVDWETSQITTEEIEDEAAPEGIGEEEAVEPAEEAAGEETPEGIGQEEALESAEEAADAENPEDAALETGNTEEVTADAEKPEADTEANAEKPEADTGTEEETSDTAAGKTVTIRQVEEKTAEIVFAEEDRELGIDEISSKLKMILVQDLVSEEAPASDSEEAAENAGTKDKETSDEKDTGEKAAGENTEDNRAGENAGNVNPADYPAATFDDRITVTAGSLNSDTETGSSHEKVTELIVHVEADEGTFPAGTTMRLAEADPDIVAAALEVSVEGRTKGFHAVDISFWSAPGDDSSTEPVEIEPLKPIRVSITSEAIRQAVEDSSTAPLVVHVEDPADQFDKENSADKSDADDKADKSVADDEADAADKADKSDEADIAVKAQDLTETKDAETEGNTDTLTFEADSFSVYAVVYTVDFHYEINGKITEFSIPGGGFASLEHVVEVLGIASTDENTVNGAENTENGTENENVFKGEVPGINEEDENGEGSVNSTADGEAGSSINSMTYEAAIELNEVEVSEATKKFVADVVSVEFSSPELVWVGKADEDSTVGGLKGDNGLDCQYCAELTEEQIAEINAQTVEAGDWALISVQSFDSEETLTVTMRNGDQFVIRVTDAQISTHVITADGEDYLITVAYGSEARIPDGAELYAREILEGTGEYESHLSDAVSCLNEKEYLPELPEELELLKAESRVKYARIFDVSILVNGIEIEPEAPVSITIDYMGAEELEEGDQASIVHFASEGIEIIEAATNKLDNGTTRIQFEQFGFSAIATIVNDNSLPIDGEEYLIVYKDGNTIWVLNQNGQRQNITTTAADENTYVVGQDNFLWKFQATNTQGVYEIVNKGNGNHITLRTGSTGSPGARISENRYGTIMVTSTSGNRYIFKNSGADVWLGWNDQFNRVFNGYSATGFYLAKVYTGKDPTVIDDDASIGITISPDQKDLLEEWEESLTSGDRDPFQSKTKTAQVYNYANRIYQIDLTAESAIKDFYQDVDLGFMLDASNSMKFPAKLVKSNTTSTLTQDNLRALYPNGGTYYIISDPSTTSTVYKIYTNGTTERVYWGTQWWQYTDEYVWYYTDASKNETNQISGTEKYKDDESGLAYPIYTDGYDAATDGNNHYRVDYLNSSMKAAIDILKVIVSHTGTTGDDESADARIAWNTFAAKLKQQQTAFKSLKDPANANLTISIDKNSTGTNGMEGGTSQDYALANAQTFGWASTNKRYAILITDGAALATKNRETADQNDTTQVVQSKVLREAEKLKAGDDGILGTDDDVTLITVGLSTKNVSGGSNLLKFISSEVGGVKQFYDAENADDLKYILLQILQSMMAEAMLSGEVSDTIDNAFYPVKQDGTPIQTGTYDENWNIVTVDSNYTQPYCEVTVDGTGAFKLTWKNQTIGNDSTKLHKTFYIKAKEDFLGGNKVNTNKDATITATSYTITDENGNNPKVHPIGAVTKALVETSPKVNVDELALTNAGTSWTVYLDSTVDPMTQLQNLYNNIDVREVVNSTGIDHRMPDAEAMNAGRTGDSEERFPLSNITGQLTEDQILTLLSTGELGITYGTSTVSDGINAYGHSELGEIKIVLNKDTIYADGENRITVSDKGGKGHTANKTGLVESYVLTVTYEPDSTGAATTYTNTVEGKAGDTTGSMTSENTHDITVIKKGIKITKVDATNNNQGLPGAVFALYRVDANGTADVSDYRLPTENNYVLVDDSLQVDSNGIVSIDPVYPDKTADSGKTIYLPNNTIGGEPDSHDTVYYLVEKTPPTGDYAAMPGAMKFTLNLSEEKPDEITSDARNAVYHGSRYKESLILYNWMQGATIENIVEVNNGTTQYLIADGEADNVYAVRIKNGKPTDITLIKTDKNSGISIGGAKFRLVYGTENVDLTELTITANTGGGTITPEDYDFYGTPIKVVTVPEGGIKIAGLVDGTYTLYEVAAPAGYVITDQGKTFETENGVIKNHTDEAVGISFKVENTPGAELPHTGGPGTTMIYILGIMLTAFAGPSLVLKKIRKEAA